MFWVSLVLKIPETRPGILGCIFNLAGWGIATTPKPCSTEQSKPGPASTPVHRAAHGARCGEVDMEHLLEPHGFLLGFGCRVLGLGFEGFRV